MGGLQVLGRTYRHLNRYREVAAVLAKHGFGDLLHMMQVEDWRVSRGGFRERWIQKRKGLISAVAAILAKGGAWFAKTGTAASSGTKVFSLVGKVKNTGLVELPL